MLRRISTLKSTFAVTLAIATLTTSHVAESETLRDVKSSRAMQKVVLDTARLRQKRDAKGAEVAWLVGMDPTSSFAELFASGRGPERLCNWIGAYPPKFRIDQSDFRRSRELAYCSYTYKTQAGERIMMEILVPHPVYRDMVRLKTVDQFNQLQPPAMPVVASEQLEFNGFPAMFYRTEKQRCSIVFKLSKESVVNLSTRDCKWSNVMIEFAKFLDVARLQKKLDS